MDIDKVAKDMKDLRIQGARSIAIAGLRAVRDVAERHGFGREFSSACAKLTSSRPTAVALHNALESVKEKRTVEEIDRMIYYFENVAPLIASQNYKIIKNGSTVLTHCHSSVAVELLKEAWQNKINFRVIVTETRPMLQGKQTAKELSEAGMPVIYADDSSPGHFYQMHKRKINMFLVGIDSIRKEGVVNKIGTYLLAVFAKENKIPVYFVGELMKVDRRKEITIEERNPEEIISSRALPKVTIENPAFDITPWKYVTGLVTEKGVLKPEQVKRLF